MIATYAPPPVDEMNQALSDLEKFTHTGTDVPILARAAMIHSWMAMGAWGAC
jgi:hypothetical protein